MKGQFGDECSEVGCPGTMNCEFFALSYRQPGEVKQLSVISMTSKLYSVAILFQHVEDKGGCW